MPNLDSIVGLINDSMKANQFASRRFQSAKFFEIADPIKTTGEEIERKEPYIIDNNGEGTSVSPNDTYSLQVYHVVDSLNYQIADPDDYGTPGTTMQETANCRMVFFGSRARLKVRMEDVIAAAAMDFPKEFTPTILTPLGMNSCLIQMGDVDADVYSVWDKEFQGSDFQLSTDTILFSISYKIIDTYNKNCFILCEN